MDHTYYTYYLPALPWIFPQALRFQQAKSVYFKQSAVKSEKVKNHTDRMQKEGG